MSENGLKGLNKLAAEGAAIEKEKRESQGKGRAEKSQSRRAGRSDLGPLDVEKYLNNYGVPYERKSRRKGDNYNLYKISCLFNPDHGRDASILQFDDGSLKYQCWHDGCKNVKRTWFDARKQISGEDSLAPFCRDYDPNWTPSTKSKEKSRPSPSPSLKEQTKKYLEFSEKGKRPKFNGAEMGLWLEEKFKPIIYGGVDFSGAFYRYHESGVWKYLPVAEIRKAVRVELGKWSKSAWRDEAIKQLEDSTYAGDPDSLAPDPMWLNLKNTMLHLPDMETAPHSPDFMSRTQLPIEYEPGANCPLWLETLSEIFEDDLSKGDVLQEFFGYCLYPQIIFPCALLQIGGGANGKGLVEQVACAFVGNENVSHISLTRMEKTFGAIEIMDKLLNSCGETEAKQLDVTNFKLIAAGDEIQAEVKYKNDIKFKPIAKHLISMNTFPGVKEKTNAFFRRIIVMEYLQEFKGDDADPRRAEKIIAKELNGIFMWALEGLKRVLENGKIQVPESVSQAKERFRHKTNPVLGFVEEMCVYKPDDPKVKVLPLTLYKTYQEWCEEGKAQSLGKINFYENIRQNFPKVKKRRDSDGGTREFYYGIGLSSNPYAIDI